jgi:DNA-binding CsgD family transcriptional regulator
MTTAKDREDAQKEQTKKHQLQLDEARRLKRTRRSNVQIARDMGISESSVRTFLKK